jgi:sugar phosphate isomerase/epimerase
MPDVGPVETARAAAAAGYDAVGVWVEPPSWTSAVTRDVKSVLADSGLYALDVEVIWIKPGPDDPDHFRVIDIGAEVGARNALVVSSDPDPNAAAEKFGRLVDHGRSRGVRVSLEFAAFTEVRSLAAALQLLERCGRPDAGLLIDPLHLARTGGRPADLAAVPGERFAYAQFCDAPASGPPPEAVAEIVEEALDLRSAPGEGALPLEALLTALPAGLPLSLEVRSKALRDGYPDPADRARVLLQTSQAWFSLKGHP